MTAATLTEDDQQEYAPSGTQAMATPDYYMAAQPSLKVNKPLHAEVMPTPHTARFWRDFMSLLATRYLGRGMLAAFKIVDSKTLDNFFRVDTHVEQLQQHVSEAMERGVAKDAMYDLKGYKLNGEAYNLLEGEQYKNNQKFAETVREGVRSNRYDHAYSTFLGLGTLGLTAWNVARVENSMKKLYAEAVSYEKGAEIKATDIGFRELCHSDNKIVQDGIHNLFTINGRRAMTGLGFCGRELARLEKWFPKMALARALPFEDIGLGIMGLGLFIDNIRGKQTLFENLSEYVAGKMHPLHGMADPIKSGELIDLYQRYKDMTDKSGMFHDILATQHADPIDWDTSQVIFSRMAQLMNDSYKYKHTDDTLTQPGPPADLPMPKFIYLLGHDMIDLYQPEKTLAYIEISSKYGIEAMKSVHNALLHGMGLDEALKNTPVDLSVIRRFKAHDEAHGRYPNNVVSDIAASALQQAQLSRN